MTSDDQQRERVVVPEPIETLPVTLLELAVLAARGTDGSIYLSIRDVCQALAISLTSQRRRLQNHPVLREGLTQFRVPTPGGRQTQDFLLLEHVPTWLVMINTSRSDAAVSARLIWYQRYIIREVYRAFAALTGLPDAESRQIEDLDDLRRFDSALTALTEQQGELHLRHGAIETRQEALEMSQDQARQVWLDLRNDLRAIITRVDAIEARQAGVISRAQRGYIYQLVQAWGAAKAERDSRLNTGAAYAACWTVLKAKYKIARYEDLPAAKYGEAVAFIRDAYRTLTGQDLNLPEQNEMDLGGG
jgi:hypothetical protein